MQESLRDYIVIRDNGRCVYCGDYGEEIDHVFPRKHKGKDIKENLVLSCMRCNHEKSGKLQVWFIARAFKHLLDVGESLDWVDKYLGNQEIESNPFPKRICLVCKEVLPPRCRFFCSAPCRRVGGLKKQRREMGLSLEKEPEDRLGAG